MKTWLRWILIITSVGGGFAGFLMTLALLPDAAGESWIGGVVIPGFAALYVFVTVAGLRFALNEQRVGALRFAFWLQVPWISSPLITWQFTAGCHLTLSLVSASINFHTWIGSIWYFALLQDHPWGIGVNLFAVLLLVLLGRVRRTEAQPLPTPASGIESVLNSRLANTPLAGREIHLRSLPDGGVSVSVGNQEYSSLDAVPDDEIRTAIRGAIAEWEDHTVPGAASPNIAEEAKRGTA